MDNEMADGTEEVSIYHVVPTGDDYARDDCGIGQEVRPRGDEWFGEYLTLIRKTGGGCLEDYNATLCIS